MVYSGGCPTLRILEQMKQVSTSKLLSGHLLGKSTDRGGLEILSGAGQLSCDRSLDQVCYDGITSEQLERQSCLQCCARGLWSMDCSQHIERRRGCWFKVFGSQKWCLMESESSDKFMQQIIHYTPEKPKNMEPEKMKIFRFKWFSWFSFSFRGDVQVPWFPGAACTWQLAASVRAAPRTSTDGPRWRRWTKIGGEVGVKFYQYE